MKLLLDECVPGPLKREFSVHDVSTKDEAGFKGLKNGDLLRAASKNFDVLITVDKSIQHQHNRFTLPMAILILSARTNKLEDLLPLIPNALATLETISTGTIVNLK